jgi:acetyltransferase-like isoleucine patch superfamily enzyme
MLIRRRSVVEGEMTQEERSPMRAAGAPPTVRLGEGAIIDDGVVLGYAPSRAVDRLLIVGPGARIRSGSVLYGGSRIGCDLETGHNVVIREQNVIGNGLRIWGNSIIDYGCTIGNNVKIHSNVYISQFTILEDEVFIGPGVTLANDIHPGCPDALRCMEGPKIRKGAQIGVNACVLPRVVIGEHALVGAGSVVTRDIPAGAVAYGNPARVLGKIADITCTTGLRDRPYGHLVGRLEDAHTIG